jgi:hypothetical protein
MKVRRLQIEQQMAQLQIDSRFARISIESKIRRMRIEQQNAQMTVQREDPKIELDLEAFKDNIGLKEISTLTQESAARAHELAKQGIRETVSNGNYVGTLPSHGNSIAQIAMQNMLKPSAPQTNRSSVPDGAVKMKGNPGDFNIDWSRNDITISWDQYEIPVITVEPPPPYVTIALAQKPALEFSVVEQSIPPETGNSVDMKV